MIGNPQLVSQPSEVNFPWISLAYYRRQKGTVASNVTRQKKTCCRTIFIYKLKAFLWNALSLILQSLSRQNLQRYLTDNTEKDLGCGWVRQSFQHVTCIPGREKVYVSYSFDCTTVSNFVYLETWLLIVICISKILWHSLQGCETQSVIDVLN